MDYPRNARVFRVETSIRQPGKQQFVCVADAEFDTMPKLDEPTLPRYRFLPTPFIAADYGVCAFRPHYRSVCGYLEHREKGGSQRLRLHVGEYLDEPMFEKLQYAFAPYDEFVSRDLSAQGELMIRDMFHNLYLSCAIEAAHFRPGDSLVIVPIATSSP